MDSSYKTVIFFSSACAVVFVAVYKERVMQALRFVGNGFAFFVMDHLRIFQSSQQSLLRNRIGLIAPFLLMATVSLAIFSKWEGIKHYLDDVVLGALLGFVLIPWAQLHFNLSRSQTSEVERTASESRFRLLTIIVGVIVFTKLALPYVDQWFRNASSVEVTGILKLAMADPRPKTENGIVLGAGTSTVAALGGEAARVRTSLDRVIQIGIGGQLTEKPSLGMAFWDDVLQLHDETNERRPYSARSMAARDTLMTVFLFSRGEERTFKQIFEGLSRAAQSSSSIPNERWAEAFRFNHDLFRRLGAPLQCLRAGALVVRDFRILLFDIHPLIRWLQRLSAIGETPRSGANTVESSINYERLMEKREEAIREWRSGLVTPSRVALSGFLKQQEVADYCQDEQNGFDDEFGWLTQAGLAPPGRPEVVVAQRPLIEPLREAPYGAIATAALFSGVGGTESAISILARWLESHVPSDKADSLEAAARTWARIRTILELDLRVPKQSLDISASTEMARLFNSMMSEVKLYIPDLLEFYSSSACTARLSATSDTTSLFREVQQEFFAALSTSRFRVYDSLTVLQQIDHELIDEARKLANMSPSCLSLVSNFTKNADYMHGNFLTYLAELQRNFVQQNATTTPSTGYASMLEEAASTYERARETLRRHADRKKLEASETRPNHAAPAALHRFELWPREKALLGVQDDASDELRTVERGRLAVQSLLNR